MDDFLKTVNYTSCNEDSRSEYRALQIKSDDAILCITGSGSRPLELLIKQPASIVSIDFNPLQNYLLELKMKAFQLLDYEELLAFLGILQSIDREHTYQMIRTSLSIDAMNFWDKHQSIIKKGVIYQGRWERYFHTLALVIGIERPNIRRRLFNSTNIQEQKKIWRKEWDTLFWKIFLRIISPRIIWKLLFQDPGFYQYVPGNSYIYRYIYNRFNSAVQQFLFKESPFAILLFFGKYTSHDVLPIYLQRENFNLIRDRLDCIQIVTDSVYGYLGGGGKQRFSKYSLSDFHSYLSDEEYVENWWQILKSAKKRAIICERQWLVKQEMPEAIQNQVIRFNDLERELSLSDDSIFYTFNISQKK